MPLSSCVLVCQIQTLYTVRRLTQFEGMIVFADCVSVIQIEDRKSLPDITTLLSLIFARL